MDEYNELEEDQEELEIQVSTVPAGATDRTIEKHFATGRLRVIQDKNDFFLPHVLDFIEGRSWGNLRPEYQRRLRWDNAKKSKLIESFIMNVPVPPIFLYETEIGRFEVMDGQQRLNAIVEFFKGAYKLSGLKIWPSLNGRTFAELPPLVRKGLERAKVSAITLMSDTSEGEVNALDLRAQVFERLNTGGERLNAQELRNSLYSGNFNRLIVELAGHELFTDAWDIPSHKENTLSDGSPSDELKRNVYYKRMSDVEIVLRFFAFCEPDKISGSVRSMLDNVMKRHKSSSVDVVNKLGEDFLNALEICHEVMGDMVFRIPTVSSSSTSKDVLSKSVYDAEMVAFHILRDRKSDIINNKDAVKEVILQLVYPESDSYELMIGRANTAAAIRERFVVTINAINGVI